MQINDGCLTVANIISTSFSGSTWLNLLLGSHSLSCSVGEIKHALRSGALVCSLHGPTCPLWGQITLAEPSLLEVVAQRATAQCLVINNSRNALPLQAKARIHSRFIHLLRDGRAVVASRLRKQKESNTWRAARVWAHNVRRNFRTLRRLPAADVLTLRYEDVLADTAKQLTRLCMFLGLDYEPTMQRFWEKDHHFIGGSPSTLRSLARYRGLELPDIPKWRNVIPATRLNDQHYDTVDPAAFHDERWKKELSNTQLRVFALAAGRLNRKLGYPKATDREGRRGS